MQKPPHPLQVETMVARSCLLFSEKMSGSASSSPDSTSEVWVHDSLFLRHLTGMDSGSTSESSRTRLVVLVVVVSMVGGSMAAMLLGYDSYDLHTVSPYIEYGEKFGEMSGNTIFLVSSPPVSQHVNVFSSLF